MYTLHKIDTSIRKITMVTTDDWTFTCQNVKKQCNYTTKSLIDELDTQFLIQEVMNATKLIYPQYYLHH